MKNSRVIKLNKTVVFSFLISVGLLLFNATLRAKISPLVIMAFNIPVYLGFLFFLPNSTGIKHMSKKFLTKGVFTWLALLTIMLISMIGSGSIRLNFIIAVAVPVVLGFVELKKSYDIVPIFAIWLKILNFVLLLVALGGVFDLISGYSVTNFFTEFYKTEAILQMRIDEPERIISVLGHPLVASEIGLIGCICNYIDTIALKTSNYQVLGFAVSLVVIALSGSKIAFFLALIIMLMLSRGNHKIRNTLLLVIIAYGIYSLGLFDVVIERFVEGVRSGDLSTGRNVRLEQLYSAKALEFNFFSGHEQELSEHFVIALEYPILRLSYRYGIFYTICLCAAIFLRPLIIIFRRKQFYLFLVLLFLIIDVNTFSSITATGDGMLLYSVMIFFFMNISHYLLYKKVNIK